MVNPKDVKIMFMPEGTMALVPRGVTIMEASHIMGLKISAPCGGRGACGKCRVKILTGDFAEAGISSNITALSPSTADEMRFLSNTERVSGIRLACQARIMNDAVLEIMDCENSTQNLHSQSFHTIIEISHSLPTLIFIHAFSAV